MPIRIRSTRRFHLMLLVLALLLTLPSVLPAQQTGDRNPTTSTLTPTERAELCALNKQAITA